MFSLVNCKFDEIFPASSASYKNIPTIGWSGGLMKTDTQLQGGTGADAPVPTSPDPLSPGRTDLNPSDRPGVDELPGNEGQIPLETDDDAPVQEEMTDVDIDNAEMDDSPNPR
jgi:hypothetical protein